MCKAEKFLTYPMCFPCRFLNVPFFHSMIARAESSSSDISVLIHPETALLPDFVSSLTHAYELDHDWFLIANSKRIPFFPFSLDEVGRQWIREDGKPIPLQKVLGNHV